MKKRFTLMMMVLCFLMSIPLKMMAETVTVHFIDENPLSSYDAYVFDASTDKTISEKDHPWPGKRTNYTTATVNGKNVVTWTIDLLNCTLANARIVFNDGVANSNKKFPSTGGFEVVNNGYYNNIGKTTAPSEGGSSETTTTDIYAVSHYNNNGKWEKNDNFIFTSTDKNIYTCTLKDVPANETVFFRIVKNDKEWGPNSSSNSNLKLTNEYQTIYQVDKSSVSLQIGPSTVQSTYTITYHSENNQIKCTSTSGSGTGGSTPVDWNTVSENRLKNHVYSQGFYLAGNFFSFQPKKDENQITYDDAVFKFQQQKNDATIESGKDYEVYKVEIPASLTAHAQVMYVDEFGNTKNIFGPGSAYEISKTCPETDKSNGWFNTTTNVCNPITQENTNYWNFKTRNESQNEYSDGMYNLYIAVDAKTHTVKKWKIEHDSDRRVAYFISDAPNATAMPVYDAFDTSHNDDKFSNKFYASVNFSAERNYYVISNYLKSQDYVKWTENDYETKRNNKDYVSTTNKLFLLGNGGSAYDPSNNTHLFSPNEKPMPGGDLGNIVVEYNPSNGYDNLANNDKHLGFSGQVKLANGSTKIESVSMVGDAIPGTLKEDGTWDFTSHAANMIYDDVEQCYTTTIVTTVDDGKKLFRFVGNHTEDINWYEDTDGSEPKKMARTLYTDSEKEGHTADVNDPNKVNYTKKDGAKSEAAYHIIWNRPAGRWTVRLYFYTYNVAGEPVTDYYYTISPCRDLELRDCVNIVYKNEDTKRVIKNVGEYKFLRTWSDEKAWKVSQDIDIYVVDELSADKKNNAVTLHLSLLYSKDKSGKYNVIPANTGVILGTKKKAADIEGGAVFHERTSLTSLNTVVVPMYEYNANEETVGTSVTSKLQPLTYARVVPTSEIVDGKVTYNYLFGAGKGKSVGIDCENENDFFMGFWISNGKGNFYSNSCYLSIDKETADILGVGIRNDQFNPVTHAKMVPGVIFDFANVGGTTGINEVVNQSTKLNDGKYYTLSGQQVEKPTAGGIYIHNGRKFVVK